MLFGFFYISYILSKHFLIDLEIEPEALKYRQMVL